MNVSLPDPMKDWVEQQAKGRRHSNASDYVRDLIRRDHDRAAMQPLVTEGLESGADEDFDFDAFQERMQKEHARGKA